MEGATVNTGPLVSIIILGWNSKAFLKICLESLRKKTEYPNYNVIIVDNGSVDDSVIWLKKSFPWVDIIVLDKNYGFSIGNNEGIAYALNMYAPKYVLLLNNDTEIVQENWLGEIISVAESEEDIGVVGCKLVYPDGRTQHLGSKLTPRGFQPLLEPLDYPVLHGNYMVDVVVGACFLIKRSVIEKIGGLDIGFSPFNDEESDFCMRAKKAGYKICMVSSAKVVHRLRASIDRIDNEYVRLILRRSRIRFMLLNFPLSWIVKYAPFEVILFIQCFVVRSNDSERWISLEFRDGDDMMVEVKASIGAWLHNLKRLREIVVKRQNRIMRLPLVGKSDSARCETITN